MQNQSLLFLVIFCLFSFSNLFAQIEGMVGLYATKGDPMKGGIIAYTYVQDPLKDTPLKFTERISFESRDNFKYLDPQDLLKGALLVGEIGLIYTHDKKNYQLRGNFQDGVIVDGVADLYECTGYRFEDGKLGEVYSLVSYIYFIDGEFAFSGSYNSKDSNPTSQGMGIVNCAAQYGIKKIVEDPLVGSIIAEALISELNNREFSSTDAALGTISGTITKELKANGRETEANIIKTSLFLKCLIENW